MEVQTRGMGTLCRGDVYFLHRKSYQKIDLDIERDRKACGNGEQRCDKSTLFTYFYNPSFTIFCNVHIIFGIFDHVHFHPKYKMPCHARKN